MIPGSNRPPMPLFGGDRTSAVCSNRGVASPSLSTEPRPMWESPVVSLWFERAQIAIVGAAVSLGAARILIGSPVWTAPLAGVVGAWIVIRLAHWVARRRAGVSGPPFGKAGTFRAFARIVAIGTVIAALVAALLCGSAAAIGAAITSRPVGQNAVRGAEFGAALGVVAMLLVLLQAVAAAALDRWFPRHAEVAWIALPMDVAKAGGACALCGGATLALIAVASVEQTPMTAACAMSGLVASVYAVTRLRSSSASGPPARRYRK